MHAYRSTSSRRLLALLALTRLHVLGGAPGAAGADEDAAPSAEEMRALLGDPARPDLARGAYEATRGPCRGMLARPWPPRGAQERLGLLCEDRVGGEGGAAAGADGSR